jgi:predicted AAA+ superfamily ATPase
MSIVKDRNIVPRPCYEDRVMAWMGRPVIKVLSGIRRSGKSSILLRCKERLAAQGVPDFAILHINMELLVNERFRDIYLLNAEVHDAFIKNGGKVYLFLDEVQEIPGWEKLVGSLLAEGVADLTVTGSNAHLLAGELATLLSGRYVEFPVYPLSFREYCDFFSLRSGREAFLKFLQSGGFPGLAALDEKEEARMQYLEALLDSIVLRDVVSRHKLRDVDLLRRILLFVADSVGSPVSARSLAGFLKSQRRSASVESIYNYLDHLAEAFVVDQAPVYDLRGKKLLETGGKIYFTDLGLRHALLGYRSSDIGQYLENIVYLDLKQRGWEVSVGRLGEWEVDFVAQRGAEKCYIQVAYLTPDKETLDRELRALRDIPDNYPKYLVTMDEIPPSSEEGIHRMSIEKFLLQQDDAPTLAAAAV